jgi:hypothetical protein
MSKSDLPGEGAISERLASIQIDHVTKVTAHC